MDMLKTICCIIVLNIAIGNCEDTEAQVKIDTIFKPAKCNRQVEPGDFVRYHYYGNLEDGTYFDSSFERGRTYNTYVKSGWLIPGMDDALIGMCVNEQRLATIPPSLAYGESGTDNIPPNSTLIFYYVLLDLWNKKDEIQITRTYVPEDCKRKLEVTDFVRYHYNGTLANGQPFHSSYEEDSTYDTYVGKGYLISGMDKGLIGTCMGERFTIIIPPFMAYGEGGDDKNIPGSASVRFDVEIIDFHNPKDEPVAETLGVVYEVDPETGKDNCPRRIKDTDFCRYHYNGTFIDGTVFDSSYKRNHTYDTYIGLGKIIPGMEHGLLGMCVGERRKIVMPPHLAYGENGIENIIPGSAVLVFYAYLVDVHNPKDDVEVEVLVPPAEGCRKSVKTDYITYNSSVSLMDGTLIGELITHSAYTGVSRLIEGFERALDRMCVGEKRRAIIPPHYGYGENGEGDVPGSAVLVATLEMLKIESAMLENAGFMWIDEHKAEENAFEEIDDDEDGKITLDELASYTIDKVKKNHARFQPDLTEENAVTMLFKRLDNNQDEQITKEELDLNNLVPPQHNDEL